MDRYHHLIASYGKEKKVKKISTEDKILDTTFDKEKLKEGKKIKQNT